MKKATTTRLEKEFDPKKKVMKWIRKKMKKEEPLEFRRHVIKNTEVFSCSNLKKRDGRRASDLEKNLSKGIKMQISRSKLIASKDRQNVGYDNWIVHMTENKEGKMVLELWKPNSGDCVIILMRDVVSVYCFDDTVVLTTNDGEQFIFHTPEQSTMKQLQLIFKAASGDSDASVYLKDKTVSYMDTPPRAASFASYVSTSTPLQSNPHLSLIKSPSQTEEGPIEDGIENRENRDSVNLSDGASEQGTTEKRRSSIVRRSQIMMRSPLMESPRSKVDARRKLKARQPAVFHLSLPGPESPKSDKEEASCPPAEDENEKQKKSPKRSRSLETPVKSKSPAAPSSPKRPSPSTAPAEDTDSRPTKRVSPPRPVGAAVTLSTSPKREKCDVVVHSQRFEL